MTALSTELRRLCAEKGVTGYELAKRVGTHHSHCYRWLNGKKSIDLDNVARIATALRLSDRQIAGIVRAAQRPQENAK